MKNYFTEKSRQNRKFATIPKKSTKRLGRNFKQKKKYNKIAKLINQTDYIEQILIEYLKVVGQN